MQYISPLSPSQLLCSWKTNLCFATAQVFQVLLSLPLSAPRWKKRCWPQVILPLTEHSPWCLRPYAHFFLVSSFCLKQNPPPPPPPRGEWLNGLVWAGTRCSTVAKPESWEAGSWHVPLPNTETFQRLNTASLVFHQRTLESWGGSIGNSEDIKVQPCMAPHEHKISHVFSVGILCLPYHICLFFPEVVVPLNLFLNFKKKLFWNIKLQVQCQKAFILTYSKADYRGFSGGSVVENPPADAGDTGLIRPGKITCCRATMPMHHHYGAHVP